MTRVLWYSNAPWAPTGYGNQTGLICKHLPKLGHELAVHANYGIMGTRIEMGGVRIYPKGREQYGNDFVQACADDFEAEVIVSFYDAWPLKFASYASHHTPWVAWAPIDHETLPAAVESALKFASGIVAHTRHGERVLQEAGFTNVAYIPLGVDAKAFCPGDQAEARKKLDLPADKFIVGMVGANHFYPSRKCIPQALLAFKALKDVYPDTALYLHMLNDDSKEGVDVEEIVASLHLQIDVDVFLADQFQYQLGYSTAMMADVYWSLDVLANPSLSEGFGIPIVEAMACGIPPIVTHGTAMTELGRGVGWLTLGDPWWTAMNAWVTMPRQTMLNIQMQSAYRERFEEPKAWARRQEKARARALEYDFESVTAPGWDAYLRGGEWKLEPKTSLKDEGRI